MPAPSVLSRLSPMAAKAGMGTGATAAHAGAAAGAAAGSNDLRQQALVKRLGGGQAPAPASPTQPYQGTRQIQFQHPTARPAQPPAAQPQMQKEHNYKGQTMNPRLQAGVELALEKTAAQELGVGHLAASLQQKAAAAGLVKLAAPNTDQHGIVEIERASVSPTTPNEAQGQGMEDMNKGYGKDAIDTDYDKTAQSGTDQGHPVLREAGANYTDETETEDKSINQHKSASINAMAIRNVLKQAMGAPA